MEMSNALEPKLKIRHVRTRKRTETLWLRLGLVSMVLALLILGAKTSSKEISDNSISHLKSVGRSLGSRRTQSGSDCDALDFCVDGCFEDNELIGACCKNDNVTNSTRCITRENEECVIDDLCVAELVPASGKGAECLQDFEKKHGTLLYSIILLYLFLAIAILCDDYFIPALDCISDGLGVPEDINGATFAAAGSSAPELFVSLVDNVITNPPKSVGLGTIVGSAIFNILVIIGASALASWKDPGFLNLNWRPIARDSFFYIIAIILLIAVTVTDDQVRFYEGLILLIGYAFYILFMAYNSRIFAWIDKKLGIKNNEGAVASSAADSVEEPHRLAMADIKKLGSLKSIASWRSIQGSKQFENSANPPYFEALMFPMLESTPEVERSFLEKLCGGGVRMWLSRLYYIICLPINVAFRLTIPDPDYDIFCEDKPGKRRNRVINYMLGFFLCIIWIGLLSHFLVLAAVRFGCLVGIAPSVMGLTVLALGTSIPDTITSMILARNGKGDGAVANAIGSNVFNIMVGLGLPWFLAELIYGRPSIVVTDDLGISIGILFGILILTIGFIYINKFQLRPWFGIPMIALYILYVIYELAIRPKFL